MIDPYLTKLDIAATLTAPVAAAWPRLTPAERELVEHILRCQLAAFGLIPPPAPRPDRRPTP